MTQKGIPGIKCSVFFIWSKTGIVNVTTFKYPLHKFRETLKNQLISTCIIVDNARKIHHQR